MEYASPSLHQNWSSFTVIQNQNKVSDYCANQEAHLLPDSYHWFFFSRETAAIKTFGIIPLMVVFRFSRCVITLSRNFKSTQCTESEVISSKRWEIRKVSRLFTLHPQRANFSSKNWTFSLASYFCTMEWNVQQL